MDDVVLRTRLRPRVRFPATNVVLFLATVATTLWAGFVFSGRTLTLANVLAGGIPFAAALLAILFTHEMGHYVLARRWGVSTTLPYFIPVPFGFGTLGAVIRMRSALPSRRAALDVGAAGPLAGFVVALPILFWGVAHSEVRAVTVQASSAWQSPFSLLRALLTGGSLARPEDILEFGDNALTLLATRIVHGPLPPGHELFLGTPVFLAAWLGLLVTALNLMPTGQLDGGHILYALVGRDRARKVSRAVSWGLLVATFFLTWTWLVWWALTRFVVRFGHPPAIVEEPLGPGRKAIAILSFVVLALTFIPVPGSF